MRYLLQRIVHNDLQWKRPSGGRLRSRVDAGYLAKTGFGHEDWNFDSRKAKDGKVHGYLYFTPRNPDEPFSIAFATYSRGGLWTLVGFYLNAQYRAKGPRYPDEVIRQRTDELLILKTRGDLGGSYRHADRAGIARFLTDEIRAHYHWRVKPTDVHALKKPVVLEARDTPKNASRYFTRPTDISAELFNNLLLAALGSIEMELPDDEEDDMGFPEGSVQRVMHTKRERSLELVKLVKSRFRRRHARLFCEACNFDFEKVYGQIGADFIEAHHLIPVSKLLPGLKTKPSDMVLVCSNCHRMLHRKRPWISTPSSLSQLFQTAR